jgi:hypothetical protein
LPVELLETQYVRNASKVMPVRIDREDALRPAGVISRPASEGPDRRFNVWRRYDSALTVGVETALRSNRHSVMCEMIELQPGVRAKRQDGIVAQGDLEPRPRAGAQRLALTDFVANASGSTPRRRSVVRWKTLRAQLRCR